MKFGPNGTRASEKNPFAAEPLDWEETDDPTSKHMNEIKEVNTKAYQMRIETMLDIAIWLCIFVTLAVIGGIVTHG